MFGQKLMILTLLGVQHHRSTQGTSDGQKRHKNIRLNKPQELNSPSTDNSIKGIFLNLDSITILNSGNEKDSPYTPSSDLRSSDSDVDEGLWLKYCTDPKYVVFGSHFDRIFYSMECTKCCGGHISELSVICVCGNVVTCWDSKPMIGQASIGNLLCSASALFSGQTFETMDFFSSILDLKFIGKSHFYDLQDEFFFAAIHSTYKENVAEARREVGNEVITVYGDGRCDSPGHNAKYGSYTMMNMSTNKILSMALVQVSEATSSMAMKKVGFKRTMQELVEAGVNVGLDLIMIC